MEIAFIHPSSPASEGSGATHSATKIVNELAAEGHSVTVYCTSQPKIDRDQVPYELKQLDIPNSTLKHFSEALNSEIRRHETEFGSYDIVHSYLMRSVPAMGQLGIRTRTNPVVTLNAYGAICPRNDLLYKNDSQCTGAALTKCMNCLSHESVLRSRSEQNSVPKTIAHTGYRIQNRLRNYRQVRRGHQTVDGISRFHALSPPVKDHYGNFGFPKQRISVIPNMLDAHFDVPHQSDFSEPFDLLYVGAMRHRKGVDRLIDVAKQLRSNHDIDINLSVVGDGPLLPTLKARAAAEELEDILSFLGYVPYKELPTVYATHDLFIYLGRWDEPFGRVFLESLSAGTPVFATNVGDISSIVGKAGTTTSRSTSHEITADLARSLTPSKLERWSEQSKYETEPYSSDRVIEQFHELYRGIL